MEKPAVIFSEQGFRDFLKFIQGIMTKPEGDEAAVDALVKAYTSYKAIGEPQQPAESRRPISTNRYNRRDYEAEYETLKGIMYGKGVMKLSEVYEAGMCEHWGTDKTQSTSKLQDLIKKFGGIEKIAKGVYQMPGPDDIVLKLKEPYFSQGAERGGEHE